MNLTRPPRGHYTETEVARLLEVSLEELRELVRHHILESDEHSENLAITCYQPADVLLLRLLVGNRKAAAA
ncbi:MAG TPA: hypothetical protein DCY80_08440 [Solibacterales bacterium]|nr:hypothetical protein [Bryobacterales bacterium]